MTKLRFREMKESDNVAVAALVRDNLKKFNLDIPGTVYFDEGLDHLSDYYGNDERRYYVIEDDIGEVIGGIGYDRFEPMKDTAELQKLYLTDSAKTIEANTTTITADNNNILTLFNIFCFLIVL